MRNLLQDAQRDRLVAPLAGRLAGEVSLGGRRFRALADSEGNPFFDAEANARAAELLMLPGLREGHAALGDALLDFAMAMAEAAPPARRIADARLEIRRDDPRDVEVVTPFLRLTGDLSRGEVRHELRGGPPVGVRHTGNLSEFRIGRQRNCVDVEDTVVDCAVERSGDRVALSHVSRIRGLGGLLTAREMEVGTLEMRYEVTAASPVLRVTARFTAARGVALMRISTALDALEMDGLGATAARVHAGGAWQDPALPATPGGARLAEGVPVTHVAVGREGWPAGAPVLHLRPAEPGRVLSVTVRARQPGVAHWLILRHGPARLSAGETMTVQEDRLLAPGGDVAAAAGAMAAGTASGAFDPDPRPREGAALVAAASALALDAAGAWEERLPEGRRAALAGFLDRRLARIEATEPEGEVLAQAAIAADALRRAGRADAAALQARLVARLIRRIEAAGGLLAAPGEVPSLAAQSLALLALARAATGPEAERALAASPALLGTLARDADGGGLVFAGRAVHPPAEATALALLARAAGAVLLAAEAGAPVAPPLRDRAREMHRLAIGLLRPLVRPREGRLEVLAQEGLTAGVQAAVTLALMAPDRLLMGAGARAHATA